MSDDEQQRDDRGYKYIGMGMYEDRNGQRRTWTGLPLDIYGRPLGEMFSPLFKQSSSNSPTSSGGNPIVLIVGLPLLIFFFEIIVLVIMPYLLLCAGLSVENYHYHPIIGIVACFIQLYLLILVSYFWFTAYPFSLFASLSWSINIFDGVNDKNRIGINTLNNIFSDPQEAFSHIFDSLKNGINLWLIFVIYTFICLLFLHILLHFFINAAYKALSPRQRGSVFLVALCPFVFVSLAIGGKLFFSPEYQILCLFFFSGGLLSSVESQIPIEVAQPIQSLRVKNSLNFLKWAGVGGMCTVAFFTLNQLRKNPSKDGLDRTFKASCSLLSNHTGGDIFFSPKIKQNMKRLDRSLYLKVYDGIESPGKVYLYTRPSTQSTRISSIRRSDNKIIFSSCSESRILHENAADPNVQYVHNVRGQFQFRGEDGYDWFFLSVEKHLGGNQYLSCGSGWVRKDNF